MIQVSRVRSADFYALTSEGVRLMFDNPDHEPIEHIFLIKHATHAFMKDLAAFFKEAGAACFSLRGRVGLFVLIPDLTPATMFWLRFGGQD